jgi:hypothetical protein
VNLSGIFTIFKLRFSFKMEHKYLYTWTIGYHPSISLEIVSLLSPIHIKPFFSLLIITLFSTFHSYTSLSTSRSSHKSPYRGISSAKNFSQYLSIPSFFILPFSDTNSLSKYPLHLSIHFLSMNPYWPYKFILHQLFRSFTI